jgi:hypothetical protein
MKKNFFKTVYVTAIAAACQITVAKAERFNESSLLKDAATTNREHAEEWSAFFQERVDTTGPLKQNKNRNKRGTDYNQRNRNKSGNMNNQRRKSGTDSLRTDTASVRQGTGIHGDISTNTESGGIGTGNNNTDSLQQAGVTLQQGAQGNRNWDSTRNDNSTGLNNVNRRDSLNRNQVTGNIAFDSSLNSQSQGNNLNNGNQRMNSLDTNGRGTRMNSAGTFQGNRESNIYQPGTRTGNPANRTSQGNSPTYGTNNPKVTGSNRSGMNSSENKGLKKNTQGTQQQKKTGNSQGKVNENNKPNETGTGSGNQ